MSQFIRLAGGAAIALAITALSSTTASAQPMGYADPHAGSFTVFNQAFGGSTPGSRSSVMIEEDSGQSVDMDARLRRQVVSYPTTEAPGTIVIDTPNTYL